MTNCEVKGGPLETSWNTEFGLYVMKGDAAGKLIVGKADRTASDTGAA